MTYKEPERVARLVNRLKTDEDSFYIHFDTSIGEKKFQKWKNIIEANCNCDRLEVTRKIRCKWASIGLVDVLLDAMKHFESFDYDYFIDLSGECYPIKPIHEIKAAFDSSGHGYMEFFKLPYERWTGNGGLDRVNHRYSLIKIGWSPYPRIIHFRRLRNKIPRNLTPFGGSIWFCLPKNLVKYVVDFVDANQDVRDFFTKSFAPDEMFFQTILMNSPYQSMIVNDHRRYIDWTEGNRHPKTLTIDDFKALLSSDKLFARKFNLSVDKRILRKIDEMIHGYVNKPRFN
ncbi:MAG: beta-1,6-N-acetylglucosaminyltransferase [Candidatus Bathyarchaeota archaeon]|nr:beta-1,6-N-acetylglucosaminyltransferase [Candidatus Bathyarchaeota archaeon]